MQLCILWAAQREQAISLTAFKVWFAAQETKYWRNKDIEGEPYRYNPKAFQPEDVGRLIDGVGEAGLRRAFRELEATNLLTISIKGVWFAEHLHEVKLGEQVKQRALIMFRQLHRDTRDKIMAFPRRFFRLIAQCGKQMVRVATILGLLLRTMLEKRKEQYGGYKGCAKASWIANLFGVAARGVKGERRKLVDEGWFVQDKPTPVPVQKKHGLWLRLDLEAPTESPEPVDNSDSDALQLAPQNDPNPPEPAPLFNQNLSSNEETKENQNLPPSDPGVSRPNSTKPTWNNINIEDLRNPQRRIALFEDAVERDILRDTEPDRLTFFAGMARTLRLKTIISNVGGFFRSLIQVPECRANIAQMDEDTARRWLAEYEQAQERRAQPVDRAQETASHDPELSHDANTVWVLTQKLGQIVEQRRRQGFRENLLKLAQRHGELTDWTQERWERAEIELSQARLLRARARAQQNGMDSAADVIDDWLTGERG